MLRIYKASAGSGKTYTLVKEYLRLALKAPMQFRHILAITFTNKAANEMKSRVLDALKGLANSDEKYNSLSEELCEAIGKISSQLKKDAAIVLRNMLHNYADISISTIDSFVHRIVRSFAHDLHLPMSFEIEMDSNELLNEAVELLLDRLSETDAQVTQAVIDFAEDKVEEGKNWKIEYEIAKLGRQLFIDESQPHIKQLSLVSFDDLREARNSLYAFKTLFEQKLFEEGKKAFELILASGLTAKDFHQGARGIFGYFKDYSEKFIPEKIRGNSYVHATIEDDKWGKKFSDEGLKEALRTHYFNITGFFDADGKNYFLADLLLKIFYSFILLADLQKLLAEIKREENILHISDFQQKVFEIVKEQDAPVVYERIGERYDNILIDEFQDTSVLQFRNLLPLIENSQFKNEDSLIVGDGKQAIYRFRGGDVAQFAQLPKVLGSDDDEILKGREIAIGNYGVEEIPLQKNFRSRKEIIDFNNSLYKELIELPELNHKAIYADYFQDRGREDDGGFVSIEFLKKNAEEKFSLNDMRALRVREIVNDVLQRGYTYKDVAVLTRSNENASFIASQLIAQGIKVVSQESLLIHHSPKVRLLLSLLSFLDRKDNHISRAEILHYTFLQQNKLLHYDGIDFKTTSHEFEKIIEQQTGIKFRSPELSAGRLSDLLQQLIFIFKLNDEDPFVQFFLDEVLLFSSRYGNNIGDFLKWWEKVKANKSIIYPETMDAVRIMTIHKSKGLQFPVVILADASEEQKPGKEFFWVGLEKRFLPQLNIGLLPNTKNILETEFATLRETEESQTFLDMLNLLYVGTTRAEDSLYILSKELKKLPQKNNSVTALLISFLKTTERWDEFRNYIFGDESYSKLKKSRSKSSKDYIKQKTASKNLLVSSIQVKMNAEIFWSASTTGKINAGSLLHEALKRIRYAGDEDAVVEKFIAEGIITEGNAGELKQKLKAVTEHSDMKKYFERNVRTLNERPLLKKNEKIKIPDRVVLNEDGATVIDYKTGSERPEHKQQLQDYAERLEEAGIKVKEKILFYTKSEKAQIV